MMQYVSSSDDEDDIGLKSLDISNDKFYRTRLKLRIKRHKDEEVCPKPVQQPSSLFVPPVYGSKTIKHSIAAYDLWKAFFPTHLAHDKLRTFHRPKLRHYNTGPQARTPYGYRRFPIKNLTRHIYKNHLELKAKVTKALQNGVPQSDIVNDILLIKHAKDLSAKSGELFLFEYSEEFPPVLGQVGMASNIKNYFAPLNASTAHSRYLNRKNSTPSRISDSNKPNEVAAKTGLQRRDLHNLPDVPALRRDSIGYPEELAKEPPPLYFCSLKPGAASQMLENNLYRAPIFKHDMPSCDFLVIRTRNGLYVRSVRTIFVVGQTMPLVQIPPPTDRHITKFRCDLSNLYIHKLFAASDTDPPSLKLDNLTKLFPDYPRKTLRKRMFLNGAESGYSRNEPVIQQGLSIYGSIDWLRRCKIITPEQYCCFMATLAARERLRKLNYTESMISPDSGVKELEPEILASPWNTSEAIMSMMKNRCYLDLRNHLINPTGKSSEGFSCVAWSKSPTEEQQINEARNNRTADGKQLPPPIFGKNPLLNKIKSEKLERLAIYRREAQLIAETQAKVLARTDAISSGESDDSDDDSENSITFTQQLRDLDKLVIDGQSVSKLNYEKEEEERHKLLAELKMNGHRKPDTDSSKDNIRQSDSAKMDVASLRGKILIITRTYEIEGTKIERTEIIREPKVIALYAKHKKDEISELGSVVSKNGNDVISQNNASSNASRNCSVMSHQRSRSASLGPSELCRADGMRITISKKVLKDIRPLRNCRRESTAN